MQMAHGIAQSRGFGGRQLFANPPKPVAARGAQFVRAGRVRGGGNDHHLLGAGSGRFLNQPRQARRSVDQAMRFAPPVRIRRELNESGIADPRQAERRRQHVRRERLCPARQIVRLRPAGRDAAWGRKQRLAEGIAHQAEHQISVSIHVVHDEQQLAETGLAQVLGQ